MYARGNCSLCLVAWLWALCLPVLAAGQPCATRDFIVVDDFESYNWDEGTGTRVYETWILDPPTPCDCAWVWDPALEYEIVHSGRQAMALDYNNYSDWLWPLGVERQFAHPADWTVNGVDTLVLHVRGLTTNTPTPLCLRLDDSTAKCAIVIHPDPQVLLSTEWVEWRIPLSSFAGVNRAKIKWIHLGVDYPYDPVPSGAGTMYIDDIWLAQASSLPAPEAAVCVYPQDGDVNVPQSLLLKWSPGCAYTGYEIYFGTDANAVAAATPATAGIYRGAPAPGATTFDPGVLEWGKKCYWRVDEISRPDILGGHKTIIGPVWCFTTADFLVVDDFERYTDDEDAYETVWQAWYDVWADQYGVPLGMATTGREIVHGGRQVMAVDYNNVLRPWLSAVERDWWLGEERYADWTINGGDTLVLFLRGRASNYPSPICLSVRDNEGKVAEVLYLDSHVTCATQWVEWRIPFGILTTPQDVNLAKVRRMRIGFGDPQNATPGGTGRLYIDDIRVVKSPTAAPPAQVILRYPPDGAVEVCQRTTLQWYSGQGARRHDIYFGTDANAVAHATPASTDVYRGRQDAFFTVFDPRPRDFHQTCFWRIDEVNDLHPESPCQGPVWHFTTADYLVIDDFERYNYEEGQNTRLYETWIEDYYDYWGPVLSMDIWPRLERVLPHGGWQAMATDYNNVWVPYYSEDYREFSPVGDWTVHGFDTLVLYVRGCAGNVPAPLYVRVQDSAHHIATAVHPDPKVLLANEWLEWRIPLSQLVGVNVSKVKEIGIGVGDRSNPQPGPVGIVFIDDIRVIKATP